MNQISILGCGWLGFSLAKFLITKNLKIKGSTTTQSKIFDFENAGLSGFLIDLDKKETCFEISNFLKNSELLILALPPKVRNNPNENFVEKIKNIIPFIEKSTVKQVFFISSTSVYAENEPVVTEDTLPNPNTESGKQIFEVEKLLQKNIHFETTILRLGGLIGEDRNPINSLWGKKNIPNPNAPVNLVHKNDVVSIIFELIHLQKRNPIYNIVSDYHPTRIEYYTNKAIEKNLPIPEFDTTKISTGKLVSSNFLKHKYQNI